MTMTYGKVAALCSGLMILSTHAISPAGATERIQLATNVQVAQESSEWKELVAAARKEGKVEVTLAGQIPAQVRQVFPEFTKKYGIRVNSHQGIGRQLDSRILAERSLGRYTMDVWMGGVSPLGLGPEHLIPFGELLIDPEVANQSRWYQGKHHYADIEGRYMFTWGAAPAHIFSFNTKLVKPDDIKSYWDMLDPKWKGKIVSMSPAQAGTTGQSTTMILHPKIGEKWFQRWANEMDVTLVTDARQGAEWVALGRFAIGMFGLTGPARELADQGFPIKDSLPHSLAEGDIVAPSAANIYALKNAPNPNAMKLFINWALSKETQAMFVKAAERIDSLRVDVSNEGLDPQYRIHQDREYFAPYMSTSPIYTDMAGRAEATKRLQKIMQDAGHR
jgi:iron(III) transport system substrate-binding protein